MKNFRKVLALVMVVATLFSFVAMASAKTLEDYSDATSVKYEEAVDVLSALGILNGYTDGTFKPEANIEREEMAKMVAVLRNAGDFEANLYVSANKFADAKGSWAEGYIAYCAQVGIVNGRNASTFDPEGLVTGVEVLKMLLCTLGYDAKEQGYVGANWQVNVLRDAQKSELLEGLKGVDLYAAATRDEAAQMFLNALKADMVYGYVSENIVKVTNSLYWADEPSKGLIWPAPSDAKYDGYELAYCNAILSDVPLYEIFGIGVYVDEDIDCFGRPSTVWTIKNKYGVTILEKAYAAIADFKFTEKVKLQVELGDIVNTFSSDFFGAADAEFDVYVDGALVRDYADLTAVSKITGNGVQTEVYVDGNDITVVVINTYIGVVTGRGKMPATITIDEMYTFANTEGFQKDDVVLYHRCAGKAAHHTDALAAKDAAKAQAFYVHDVELAIPTVETVIHTAVSTKSDASANDPLETSEYLDESYFQTAGQKFEYAANYANKKDVDFDGGEWLAAALKGVNSVMPEANIYDVYVDEFGYVMGLVKHEDEIEWKVGYFVEDTQDATGRGIIVNGETVRAFAQDIVEFDGMAGVKTATVDQAITEEIFYAEENGEINGGEYVTPDGSVDYMGTMARYFINEDGEADLDEEGAEWATVVDAADATDAYVVKGISKIFGTDIRTNLATEFMVRTYNWATQSYTYTVYVGYNNLPATLFGTKPVNNGATATQINSIQYLTGTAADEDADPCVATHVFIDAFYAGAEETFYLLKPVTTDYETALYPWLDSYVVYEILVDGQKANLALTTTSGFGKVEAAANDLYKAFIQVLDGVTINGLPIYVLTDNSAMEPADWKVTVGPVEGLLTVSYIEDVLDMDHIQIAPEAPIHVVYNIYDEIRYAAFDGWDPDPSYRTFTDHADFNEFFEVRDWNWDAIKVYYTDAEVGDANWNEDFTEVTELWIELQPAK